MRLSVHHIGIIATSREQIENFKNILGLKETDSGFLQQYNAESIFLESGGGTKIQFLLPKEGTLKNFNNGRGGIHHIAFQTEDILEVERELKQKGINFLNEKKIKGIGGIYFDFVFPNIAGINVEFVEDKDFK